MVNVIPLAWLEFELGRESWFCWLMPAASAVEPLIVYMSRKYVAFAVLLLEVAAAAGGGGKKHHKLKHHLQTCFALLLQTSTTFYERLYLTSASFIRFS